MYRNGIYPHEVRRAVERKISAIESTARQSGFGLYDPDIRSLLQPLYDKLDGSPRQRHRAGID
jgi:hypothetical protein